MSPGLAEPLTLPRSSWDEISLLDLVTPVVRAWKRILIFMFVAGAFAAAASFLVRPKYRASTSLVPESSNSLTLPVGLTALAGQLGLGGGAGAGPLSPDFLVSVLRSRSVLEPVLETRFVPSSQPGTEGRPLIDLMGVEQAPPNKRLALAMRALNAQFNTEINRRTGIISIEVEQPDPRLAADVANALVAELNRFNLERRQSQSRAQRIFAQERLKDAERELRRAEEAHQKFLQANRSYTESPVLFFESNRLQRGVQLKQEVYLTLSKSYEEASIAEVRDTPVLTMIDPGHPTLPAELTQPKTVCNCRCRWPPACSGPGWPSPGDCASRISGATARTTRSCRRPGKEPGERPRRFCVGVNAPNEFPLMTIKHCWRRSLRQEIIAASDRPAGPS